MKKWIIPVLITMFTCSAYAEKKVDWELSFPETKNHFVKVQMTWAKNEPFWNPTKEELEAQFDKFDLDDDGLLTAEEWEKRKKQKR